MNVTYSVCTHLERKKTEYCLVIRIYLKNYESLSAIAHSSTPSSPFREQFNFLIAVLLHEDKYGIKATLFHHRRHFKGKKSQLYQETLIAAP